MRFDELMAYAQSEGRAIGMEEGRVEGVLEARRNMILEVLEEYGDIPESLRHKIEDETSVDILKEWLKIAAKLQSIEGFVASVE